MWKWIFKYLHFQIITLPFEVIVRRGSVESEGGIQFNEWYPSSWVLPIDPSDVIIKRWLLSQTVGHLHLSRLVGEGGAG